MTHLTRMHGTHMRDWAFMNGSDRYRAAEMHRTPYLGRTAARRTAPTLPRAIRVGQNEAGKQIGR